MIGLQIRRYLWPFLAIIALIAISIPIALYILRNQRFVFPWESFYTVTAEFESALALTPGQGQTILVAGVEVGEIQRVTYEHGRALVTVRIEERYGPIHRDAQMLLRPKTPLRDMSIQLDPGSPESGDVPDGGSLPASNTRPDVTFDEVLNVLDTDSRDFLRLLVGGFSEGLEGNGEALARMIRASRPTAEQTARVTRVIADRRRMVSRLVTNMRRVAEATGEREEDIARTIQASGATFAALGDRAPEIRAALDELPGTVEATEDALREGAGLARELPPTARRLRPLLREAPAALRAARPLLRDATPILAQRIRPLVRDATPVTRRLVAPARDLEAIAPDLLSIADAANHIVNELLHDPQGEENPYLFYLAWFAHNGASILSVQDAHGVHWRGQGIFSCSTVERIQDQAPGLGALFTLPTCPEGATGAGGSSAGGGG